MPSNIDRRRYERFRVQPSLTGVAVRHHNECEFHANGHAYDVSEGGIQFELDQPIAPGSVVSLRLDLPVASLHAARDVGPGRSIFVTGNIVWCEIDPYGPARLAMTITRYDRAGDRERLVRAMTFARHQRAA